jgi:hypothetical protein
MYPRGGMLRQIARRTGLYIPDNIRSRLPHRPGYTRMGLRYFEFRLGIQVCCPGLGFAAWIFSIMVFANAS